MAQKLKAWRKSAGLTQEQVADMGGWKQPQVSQWEAGTIPDPKNIHKLAEISEGAVSFDSWFQDTAA